MISPFICPLFRDSPLISWWSYCWVSLSAYGFIMKGVQCSPRKRSSDRAATLWFWSTTWSNFFSLHDLAEAGTKTNEDRWCSNFWGPNARPVLGYPSTLQSRPSCGPIKEGNGPSVSGVWTEAERDGLVQGIQVHKGLVSKLSRALWALLKSNLADTNDKWSRGTIKPK